MQQNQKTCGTHGRVGSAHLVAAALSEDQAAYPDDLAENLAGPLLTQQSYKALLDNAMQVLHRVDIPAAKAIDRPGYARVDQLFNELNIGAMLFVQHLASQLETSPNRS